MKSSRHLAGIGLALIVLVYLVIAVQYARLTPAWQAPDEPAHYNYVRYVAEHGALPVLQVGDFPSTYLEEIKADGFPPEMSIEPLRYEGWQPPLYYTLAAGIFRATSGWPMRQQLLALRLLSVALGAAVIVLANRVADTLAPRRPWLALGTAAAVATVPMHIAMTAAVNNDTLAEVWVGVILWQVLARLRASDQPVRPWLTLGIWLGLAGLTKVNTWFVLPLVLAGLAYVTARHSRRPERMSYYLRRALAVCLPAVLILLPWLVRNMRVYGPGDPLAFSRHAEVVQGQLRTSEWLAQTGPGQAAGEFASTTFHSFWGQFGWMGVPIDSRLYRLLAFLVGLAGVGLLLSARGLARRRYRLAPEERVGALILVASVLLVAGNYLLYNLSFKQHQGRYLFPALIPGAVFLAAGWREVTREGRSMLAAALPLAATLPLVGLDAWQGRPLDKWVLVGLLGLSGVLAARDRVPRRWGRWLYVLPYPLLVGLDLLCLYRFILPALA